MPPKKILPPVFAACFLLGLILFQAGVFDTEKISATNNQNKKGSSRLAKVAGVDVLHGLSSPEVVAGADEVVRSSARDPDTPYSRY